MEKEEFLYFFFPFCVNQKTQEPSLVCLFVCFSYLWCGCTKHMHLTNIPLSLWYLFVNKNHRAADSELYKYKCKAEKPRICILWLLWRHRWLQPLPGHGACSWEYTFLSWSRSLGSGTEQPNFRGEESEVREMFPTNLYILEHKLGLFFM